jgi:hypothetical protein
MSETTSTTLAAAAEAVANLGGCQSDIDSLDDASLQAGMRMLAELDQQAQPYRLWLAAAIARRSDHTLGYGGLARKNGFPTPATFIQSLTGTSIDEATKLARLGELIVEAEAASPATRDGGGGSGATAIATAATAGGISVDAADAIRRGLGTPDAAVTAEQLRLAAEKLIARAAQANVLGALTPEALLKLARQARNELDSEAIARGEKERAEQRYARIWEKDGMFGGSWRLTGEDGGAEFNTALKLLLAEHTGGPRFPETDASGEPVAKSDAEVALERITSEDTRSMDQILADGFTQIVLSGLRADPSIVPGAGRAPVRVIVTEDVLEAGRAGDRSGTALLEDNLSAITFGKLEEYLCEGGIVGIRFNDDGTLDVGREQRLFTARQRTALGVRDGGCRFPGCDKPPSWCEAHHIEYWARDQGRTNVQLGILLCRYHAVLAEIQVHPQPRMGNHQRSRRPRRRHLLSETAAGSRPGPGADRNAEQEPDSRGAQTRAKRLARNTACPD